MSEAFPAGSSSHPVRPRAWFEADELDHQEFAAGGVRTFAIIEGRLDAFPAVFLHGIPGASFLWRPLLTGISRERLVIAPDLPGWGRSRSAFASQPFEWSAERCRQWLFDMLATQRVAEFDLVGHGMGAAIGLEFMGRHPGRVRRLALIQPSPWTPVPRSLGARIASWFGGGRWSATALSRYVAQNMSATCAATWTPFFEELLLGSGAAPGPSEIKRARAAFDDRAAAHRAVWREFPGHKLAIIGSRDAALATGADTELSTAAELHRVDAGEYPMLDAEAETRAIIQKFLTA